jgi:hypothetical protein
MDELNNLHKITKTQSDDKEDEINPFSSKDLNPVTCKKIHDTMQKVIRNLNRLSFFLEKYKNDRDVFYFIEEVKDSCYFLMMHVNLSGKSALTDRELNDLFYQLGFKLQRIIGLIEVLSGTFVIPKLSLLETISKEFQNQIMIEASYGLEFLDEHYQKDFWPITKKFSVFFKGYLQNMVRYLSIFYFMIREASARIKPFILNTIFKCYFAIGELSMVVQFNYGIVLKKPRDFIASYSKYLFYLEELLGYLEIYLSTMDGFVLKEKSKDTDGVEGFQLAVSRQETIELYTKRDCPLCRVMFESIIFDHLKGIAIDLGKGIQNHDSDTSFEDKARSYFYNAARTPTFLYPCLHNDYRAHVVNIFKDKGELKDPTPSYNREIRLMDKYFFGTLGYSSDPGRIYQDRLLKIKEIFKSKGYGKLTFKEISESLEMDFPNINHFFHKLLYNNVLESDGDGESQIKKYKLNLVKLREEIRKV